MRLRLLVLIAAVVVFGVLSFRASAGPPGTLDPSFGTGGIVQTDFGSWDEASEVAITDESSVVVIGSIGVDSGVTGFTRFGPDGSIVRQTTQVLGGNPTGLALQQVAGKKRVVVAFQSDGLAVARFLGDGTLDPSFGKGGTAVIPFDPQLTTTAVAVQTDGKIILTGFGQFPVSGDFDVAIARLNIDGSQDAGFGHDGVTTVDLGGWDMPTALAIDDVGRILVGGNFNGRILRLLPNGSIDPFYGTGKPPAEFDGNVHDMALLSDGRVVLAGTVEVSGDLDIVVALARADGSLDPAFGKGGTVRTPISTSYDRGNAVAVDAKDRIIVAGNTTAGPFDGGYTDTPFVARYLTSGALDDSFGTNGVSMDFGFAGSINKLAIQPDGKILAVGSKFVPNAADWLIARFAGESFNSPPVITVQAPGKVLAAMPAGAAVAYTVTAADDTTPNPKVNCTRPSGSVFPVGDTMVTCAATDESGNSTRSSFTVHVKGAAEQLADLKQAVSGVGPAKSLAATVGIAESLVAHNQNQAACVTLTAFNFEVRAQSGKGLTFDQALYFTRAATRIQLVIGCPGLYSASVQYDTGWSAGTNPNGVWRYGWSWTLTGPLTLFTRHWIPPVDNNAKQMWDDPKNNLGYAPMVAINSGDAYDDGNVSFAAGALLLSPGDGGSYVHLSFTAPSSGRYLVDATFFAQQYGCNADANVVVNGKPVVNHAITQMPQSFSFAKLFDLKKGQTIDLVVGPNGQAELHSAHVGLEATITRLTT